MIRNFLRNFMSGRYGPDHLNIAMIIVSLVLSLLNGLVNFAPITYVSYLILALALYRMLSRNIPRRRAENDKFIRYWWPIRTKAGQALANFNRRNAYRYFSCPGCGNTLRVPKGKGRLQITCPKCGERFLKRT